MKNAPIISSIWPKRMILVSSSVTIFWVPVKPGTKIELISETKIKQIIPTTPKTTKDKFKMLLEKRKASSSPFLCRCSVNIGMKATERALKIKTLNKKSGRLNAAKNIEAVAESKV